MEPAARTVLVASLFALPTAAQGSEESPTDAAASRAPEVPIAGRVLEEDGVARGPYTVVLVCDKMHAEGPWTKELHTDGEGRFAAAVPGDKLASAATPLIGVSVFGRRGSDRFLVAPPADDAVLVMGRRGARVTGRFVLEDDLGLDHVDLVAVDGRDRPVRLAEAVCTSDGTFELTWSRADLVPHRGSVLHVLGRRRAHRDGGSLFRVGTGADALAGPVAAGELPVRLRPVTLQLPARLPPTDVLVYHPAPRLAIAGERRTEGDAQPLTLWLPQAPLEALVACSGHAPVRVAIPAGEAAEMEVQAPGRRNEREVRGRVVDADGTPARGFEARLLACASLSMLGADTLPYQRTTHTDDEGRFGFDRLHEDTFRVQLIDRAQRRWLPALEVATGAEATVDLRQVGYLTLSFVLDAHAGNSVTSALHGTLVRHGTNERVEFTAHKSPWRTEQLPVGAYTLVVRGRPSWVALANLELRAGNNDHTLTMEPATVLAGSLRDPDGHSGYVVRGAPGSAAPWAWDVTDDAGSFALIVPAEVRELRVAVLGPREAPDQARMHVVAADRENVLAR
jgi:hypothetical protein